MRIDTEKLWFNRNNRRTYRCIAGVDLLGDWFVTKFWGSVESDAGDFRTCIYPSREQAVSAVQALSKERLKCGYTLIEDRYNEH